MDAEEHDLLLDYIESQEQPESGLFAKKRVYRSQSSSRLTHYTKGYDESLFIGDPDADLKCPICLAVSKDPVQTPCGHIFCRSCFRKLPEVNGSFECPQDRQKHHETMVFSDTRTYRKILELNVRCTMHKSGCQEVMELQYLEKHTQECGYVEVDCTNGIYKCEFCHQEMTFCHYNGMHEKRFCKKIPVTCSDCEELVIRENLQRHRSEGTAGDCPKVPVSCEYRKLGCSFRGPREEMPLHMQNDIQKHMQLLLTRQEETDEKVLSLETYQKVKEPAGSFLWAIDNWPKIERGKDSQLFLSRKFKFAGEVSMHLQMVMKRQLRQEGRIEEFEVTFLGGVCIEIYAVLLDPCLQPLRFSIFLVGDTTTKKQGKISNDREMLAKYHMDTFPLHDNILLVKLEW
ncbi:TNF receptor-associated factor 6-like isoform X2 [Oscarella lobularis]|uniref:TNF receptor-associated factor 6-like isoform X2 n=1 Tax=Oscarella lobularis TaxID=121494 RepID=UPI003313F330